MDRRAGNSVHNITKEDTIMTQRLFSSNEHKAERVARVVLGLGILSLTVVGPQTMWGLIGVVPLVTGLVGSCPLYSLFGISTCPVKAR
jgi:Protein of unknown function (DUF2892)